MASGNYELTFRNQDKTLIFLSWMGAARGNEDALMTLSGSPWMEDLKGSKSDLILRLDLASARVQITNI